MSKTTALAKADAALASDQIQPPYEAYEELLGWATIEHANQRMAAAALGRFRRAAEALMKPYRQELHRWARVELQTKRLTPKATAAVKDALAQTKPDRGGQLVEACRLITAMLAKGPRRALAMFKAGADAGISKATMRRASAALRIVRHVRVGDGTQHWTWELP